MNEIKNKFWLKLIVTISACASVLTGCVSPNSLIHEKSAKAKAFPNILFIYTDDQAPWAIGSSGNQQAITPNMDLLAAQGMSFPNAYTTTPVCSPSRAGLLTSKYGYELGIDDWINTHYKSITRQEPDLGLDTSYLTWPELLQQQGYYTGLIGKWHLGELDKYHPTKHGYNEFTGFRAGGIKTQNPPLEVNGTLAHHDGLTVDILTNYALDFLANNKNKKFALSLHYRAPHTNWLPVAAEDMAPYKDLEMQIPNPHYPNLDIARVKSMMRDYLASVHGIDRNLGRILNQLEVLGLAQNTLVIFTSDHGYNMGHNGIWHKGNGHWVLKDNTNPIPNIPADQRPNMYDNSIKVPAIIRWPGVIEAGSKNASSISNLDWYPTLVEIAGGKVPKEAKVRGQSFVAGLFDKNQIIKTDYYAAYSTLHQSVTGMRMYSDGQYKLIKDYVNKGRDEFYDLINDPAESNNLIATANPDYQIVINQFDDIIFNKMLATNDPLLKQFFGEQ
ncbi:sulfatase-like hydrolase/transferase [Catenovulum sediminis]|uniref:Sulfatase-like hydrolase/transferase n=1 Tax=Catenovulum sediminis TaxID=1740262 RepID=A0ABV1RJ39_9ALTE